jgi:hypothetical protein
MNQLALFPPEDHEGKRIAQTREYWKACWDWTPRVGEPASFSCVCAVDTNGQQHYTSCAKGIIRELGERDCVLEYVETIEGDPCNRHGKLFRISLADLWVDVEHERMKHKAKQVDIKWSEPEAFALVPEQTLDGERIVAENQQREADRKAADAQQPALI